MFLVLAAKAPASVWEVRRSESSGLISNIAKKPAYVNHYSFHIMDPAWGHVTIKMSGHPPFPAQVILNGHEYVAAAARAGSPRRATVLLASRIRRAWPGSQIPCRGMRL